MGIIDDLDSLNVWVLALAAVFGALIAHYIGRRCSCRETAAIAAVRSAVNPWLSEARCAAGVANHRGSAGTCIARGAVTVCGCQRTARQARQLSMECCSVLNYVSCVLTCASRVLKFLVESHVHRIPKSGSS